MAITPLTGFKAFEFDGEASTDYGVQILGEGVFNAPEREVEMITIPGRNGQFALDKGRFENVEVKYPANIIADSTTDFAQAVSDLRNMLCSRKGYCRLTDDYHPDEYRMAVYKEGLEVDEKVLKAGKFDITFDCKPQRWLKSGETAVTIGEWGETETASGDIVSVENPNGVLAVKSLKVDLEPIQDLNGYDKPWAGGAGKNKLDTSGMSTETASGVTFARASDGAITVGGKATATVYRLVGSIQTESGVQYTITGAPSGGGNGKYRMTVAGYGYDTGSGYTFTGDGGSHNVTVDIYAGYPSIGTLVFKPMIRLASETDATYEPYENICPISGHDSVDTYRTGKNLLDYDGMTATAATISGTADDFTIAGTSGGYNSVRFNLLPLSGKGKFRLSGKATRQGVLSSIATCLQFSYNDGTNHYTTLASYTGNTSEVTDRVIEVPSGVNSAYLILFVNNSSSSGSGMTANFKDVRLSIEQNTNYEPYQGTTYTAALGRTVYGGTLGVVSGLLTVTDANIASYNGETLPSTWISDRDVYASGTTPTTGAQVVYKLATPQTYQLTAQQISLLTGDNNIWSDGDITLEYGQNPSVLFNPTLFESSPMLMVSGNGDIVMDGKEISITGRPLGEIQISNRYGTQAITLNVSNLEEGDSIYPKPSSTSTEGVTFSFGASYTMYFHTVETTGDVAVAYSKNGANTVRASVNFNSLAFEKGTASTVTGTAVLENRHNTSFRATITITAEYDGVDAVTLNGSVSGVPSSAGVSVVAYHHAPYYGNSTKVILPEPIYIDLDIGEAYGETGGQIVSLNDSVELPSDLPKLSSGANTITYSGDITDLKIVPRWWKV